LQKLGSKKPYSGYFLAIYLIFVVFTPIAPAAEVVVNKSVSTGEFSTAEVRAIFAMQKRFWPNNKQIKVFVLADNNPIHKDFVKNILQMFPHHIRRVWERITFTGTGTAPIVLDSEQEMIDKIANTPDSIGYLNSVPDNENIHSFAHD
jgi:hypothetical protein